MTKKEYSKAMTRRELMTRLIAEQFKLFTDSSLGKIKVEFKEFWAPSNHGEMKVHFGTSKTAVQHRILKDAYFVEINMNSKKVYANKWVLGEDDNEDELAEYGLQKVLEALIFNGLINFENAELLK